MTNERKRVVHVQRQLPRTEAESWRHCVEELLPRISLVNREADLVERQRQARLLAIAALRAAGEDNLADSLKC